MYYFYTNSIVTSWDTQHSKQLTPSFRRRSATAGGAGNMIRWGLPIRACNNFHWSRSVCWCMSSAIASLLNAAGVVGPLLMLAVEPGPVIDGTGGIWPLLELGGRYSWYLSFFICEYQEQICNSGASEAYYYIQTSRFCSEWLFFTTTADLNFCLGTLVFCCLRYSTWHWLTSDNHLLTIPFDLAEGRLRGRGDVMELPPAPLVADAKSRAAEDGGQRLSAWLSKLAVLGGKDSVLFADIAGNKCCDGVDDVMLLGDFLGECDGKEPCRWRCWAECCMALDVDAAAACACRWNWRSAPIDEVRVIDVSICAVVHTTDVDDVRALDKKGVTSTYSKPETQTSKDTISNASHETQTSKGTTSNASHDYQ